LKELDEMGVTNDILLESESIDQVIQEYNVLTSKGRGKYVIVGTLLDYP